MKLETLKDLYIHELKDLYSAENQIIKALPKMVKAATNKQLAAGFEEHLEQTKQHAARLEKRGEFPARVQLGPGRVAWREDEIEQWEQNRPRGPLPFRGHRRARG